MVKGYRLARRDIVAREDRVAKGDREARKEWVARRDRFARGADRNRGGKRDRVLDMLVKQKEVKDNRYGGNSEVRVATKERKAEKVKDQMEL